jgi:hypothetical protein
MTIDEKLFYKCVSDLNFATIKQVVKIAVPYWSTIENTYRAILLRMLRMFTTQGEDGGRGGGG